MTLVRDFGHIVDLLGPRMGCFLFQLPPSFHYSRARLDRILSQLDPVRRNGLGEVEQAPVDRPCRLGLIGEVIAIRLGGAAGQHGFEKNVASGLADESPDRNERPGKHPGLPARQSRNGLAPNFEAGLIAFTAMKKIVERAGKELRASGGFNRVTQRHFLEGKEQVRPGLYAHSVPGDLGIFACGEKGFELGLIQHFEPLPMGQLFVIALPFEVGRISKPRLK